MTLSPDRYFSPDPARRKIARELYDQITGLSLVCPHGHVDPRLFVDPNYQFGTPSELLIIPDHYIFRMLYSQGVSLEQLGIPTQDGTPVETDHRAIWQRFADHFYLFRGTPTGIWIRDELAEVFSITEPLNTTTAQTIYDEIAARLQQPEFSPRALFERFNIETLCTTDSATDPLASHQAIRDSGWQGRILPTFRPDAAVNILSKGWRDEMNRLSDLSGIDVTSYVAYIEALENRREFFKSMGATATDHAALTAYTGWLSDEEAEAIFQRALAGTANEQDAVHFTGHMLMEMARMSTEDGLVMQIHIGSFRNHNTPIFNRFGLDKGADIPMTTEFTLALKPLLEAFGNNHALTVILFTLDETTYSRELAPLAGHYPALRLGPPWWFHDSLNGMARYFDQVMETAGLYNTAGFNDDTRAFPSIPIRHDVWRRASADWLAGLVVRDMVTETDAAEMAQDMAIGLAKRAYNL